MRTIVVAAGMVHLSLLPSTTTDVALISVVASQSSVYLPRRASIGVYFIHSSARTTGWHPGLQQCSPHLSSEATVPSIKLLLL